MKNDWSNINENLNRMRYIKMNMKFKAAYDQEGDLLTVYREAEVKESIEVSEEMIIDIDKNKKLVNLEFLDAYKFLHTMNEKISKKMLLGIKEIDLKIKNYRNYWIITLAFKYKNTLIEEKLPVFASVDFKSPLLAAV